MSTLEDRLRDALHATASTVDEHKERALPSRSPRPRVSSRRLIPVLAAIAVLILLAGIIGFRQLFHEPEPPLRKVPEMPKFFFASTPLTNGRSSRIEVYESRTGRRVDFRSTARAHAVDHLESADGKNFFATDKNTSGSGCSFSLARLSINDSGRIVDQRRLTSKSLRGTPGGLAIAPDGQRLAYIVNPCLGEFNQKSKIVVHDLRTGQRSEWPSRTNDLDIGLAWAGDGRSLVYTAMGEMENSTTGGASSTEVRILNLAAPPRDLTTASRLIRRLNHLTNIDGMAMAHDGHRLILSTTRMREDTGEPESAELAEMSTDTGQTLRVIQRNRPVRVGSTLIDGDSSGRFLLTGSGSIDLTGGKLAQRAGPLRTFTDIAW